MTTARQIMSGSVTTILPTATVVEAVQLLRDHRIGALPVVDGEVLVGIISLADVAFAVDAPPLGATTERLSA